MKFNRSDLLQSLLVVAVTSLILIHAGCARGLKEGLTPSSSNSPTPAPSISATVNPAVVDAGQKATITWAAQNATVVTIDNGVGTVSASGTQDVFPQQTTTYTVTATGAGNSSANTKVMVSVNAQTPNGPPQDLKVDGWLTYKFDQFRTGANTRETTLTPANVNTATFGKKYEIKLDGNIFAQPLYVRNVPIAGHGTHNIVILCTEHDSVFAYDADTGAGPLWIRSFRVNGATPAPNNQVGRTAIGPEVGVTGTPVIDPNTGTMYLSAMTAENGVEFHRLHAMDITTGADKIPPVVIQGSVPGMGTGSVNGMIAFQPTVENQRSGLALANGVLYVPFASFSDQNATDANGNTIFYHGWVFAFDAATLNQIGIWNGAPGPGGEGTSIWMGGSAPAVDSDGHIFVETADGHGFSANHGGDNYGDSFVKLGFANGKLTALDYFTPYNQDCLDKDDLDLGGGGPLIIPDEIPGAHSDLLVGGSKEGRLYVLDRANMGGFVGTNPPDPDQTSDPQIVQSILWNARPCKENDPNFDANSPNRMYSSPSYWNGNVYLAAAFNNMRQYSVQSGGQLVEMSRSTQMFDADGQSGRAPIPVISANGNNNGIVWGQHRLPNYQDSTDPRFSSSGNVTLYAFDATDLSRMLWSSGMNAARDGLGGKGTVFTTPVVIDGKVFTTAQNRVEVYGLLQ